MWALRSRGLEHIGLGHGAFEGLLAGSFSYLTIKLDLENILNHTLYCNNHCWEPSSYRPARILPQTGNTLNCISPPATPSFRKD
jgi:hypothetical protein